MTLGHIRSAVLLLSGFAAAAASSAALPVRPRPGSFGELLDLNSIALPKPWTTHQASGYDRDGGFFDSGNFLRIEDNRRFVLMECDGPGCIDRMWFTTKSSVGEEPYDLLVYLDDLAEPVIRANLDSLFDGTVTPFVEPLAGRCGNPSYPARYSYVPLGFVSRAKVVLQPTAPSERYRYRQNSRGETVPHIYYQLTYRRFSPGAAVRPFSRTLDLSEQAAFQELRRLWTQPGTSPWKGGKPLRRHPLAAEVERGATTLLLALDQPGTICGLHLSTDRPEALKLAAFWDGLAEPGISVPLGPFFGCPETAAPGGEVRGLWLGFAGGTFYNQLPMPFHHSARLFAASTAQAQVKIKGDVWWLPEPPPPAAGRLHAGRYDHAPPPPRENYMVLDLLGRGHFVGLVMDRPGHMEGDERFFVDGEATPSWHGTGTEDFFNFAWGLSHTGAFPLHGITRHGAGPVAYRFHLPASVPFQRSLRIDWEHGHDAQRGPNLDQQRYSGVAFYYRAP